MSSFDVMLCVASDRSAKFKGLGVHRDVFPDEPGQLNAVVTVHPPPPGWERLSLSVAFYPNKVREFRALGDPYPSIKKDI